MNTRPQPATLPSALWVADQIFRRFQQRQTSPWGSYTIDLTLEALAVLYTVTRREPYLHCVRDFAARRNWQPADEQPYGQPPFTWLAWELYRLNPDPRFVAPYVRQSDRYRRETPRSPEGAVLHPRGAAGGHALLIDHVQEYAARMARAGAMSQDETFYTECVDQFRLYRGLLRDSATGLYCQGRGWLDDPLALSPGFWSRGQGWLIRGLVEALRSLPRDSSYFVELQPLLAEFAAALLRYQDEAGLWHGLVDRPAESPPDSSGTGLIAYSLARSVAEGFLPSAPYAPAALRACASLRPFVTAEGVVQSESPGPGPLYSIADYRVPAFPAVEHHGPGAVLYALAGELLLTNPSPTGGG